MTEKLRKGLFDLTIILLLPIFASVIASIYSVNYLWSIILFLGLPSLFLSIRLPKCALKALSFSIVASIPTILVVDYIGQIMGQWIIPSSVSSFRFFGVVPIEQGLWAVLNFYSVIMFYEYFLNHHVVKKTFAAKFKYLYVIGFAIIAPFITVLLVNPSWLRVPYFYFIFGILLIGIPAFFEVSTHAKLTPKFLKTAAYFFYLSFIYEITALKHDWWQFPGWQFVGWISLLNVRFPLEELLFWIILFAMAILGVYEKFDDDQEERYLSSGTA
ncbi:MAG: hypothetical protein WCG48_01855 [Candidatus Berkelbacteria bacterium]